MLGNSWFKKEKPLLGLIGLGGGVGSNLFGGVAEAPFDMAVAHFTSPYVSVYPWTPGSGFGTKYADPSTLPTNGGKKLAFTPAA